MKFIGEKEEEEANMLQAQIIRSLAGRNLEKNICLANAALRHVFAVRHQATQAATPTIAQPKLAIEYTTGWNKAKWPQQEMMDIHRRAMKNEAPGLERRRQLAVLKVLIGVAACAGAFFAWALFMLMFFGFDPHAPWHTTGLPTPWTNGCC